MAVMTTQKARRSSGERTGNAKTTLTARRRKVVAVTALNRLTSCAKSPVNALESYRTKWLKKNSEPTARSRMASASTDA